MKDKIRKSQFKYLNYLFESMYSVKSKFYTDSTFFKKNDKVILELEKSGTLWVLYSVWSDISNMFSYGYEETQQLIKEWVESQLKKEEVAPSRASSMYGLRIAIVEEKLNSEVVVPEGLLDGGFTQVEKQLNSEEITLSVGQLYVSDLMEEQLKSAEVTPLDAGSNYLPWMEKQLKQEEITPRSAIAPPFRWRKLDSVKYAEIKPTISTSYHLEEQLKSEEITPRQVVPGSFDWVQEQIIPEKIIQQI
jgi:hypothetical protein